MRLRMAGLGEVALLFGLLIGFGVEAVIAVCVWIAFRTRSRIAASLGVLFAAACGVLFQPWAVLLPVDGPLENDAAFWLVHYRIHAALWFPLAAAAVGSLYLAWFRRRSRRAAGST